MIDPSIVIMLAKARRELTRVVALGLLLTYLLAALAVCSRDDCGVGLQHLVVNILGQARPYLWQGIALAYLIEFTGGVVFMTIGLAWDWWKERPAKAAAKAKTEAYAAAYAEAQAEFQAQTAEYHERLAEHREQLAEHRERLLRNGIDPDTGERLPHFNSGANATDDHA